MRVAEIAGRPVGFAELEADGRVGRVYVSADHLRRGIGRVLLAEVIAEAARRGLPRLTVDASPTARPFFEALGFAVYENLTGPGYRFRQFIWRRHDV